MHAWGVEKAQLEAQLRSVRGDASRGEAGIQAAKAKLASQKVAALEEQLAAVRTPARSSRGSRAAPLSQQERAKFIADVGAAEAKLAGQSATIAMLQERVASKDAETAELAARLVETSSRLSAGSKYSELQPAPEGEGSWRDMRRIPVWVWWNFPNGVPIGYRLNVRTWMRHIPSDRFVLHLVNYTNIKSFIPDLPDAFYRLYQLAQSDFVRAAMLALHGGVYMDGDMLLRDDLNFTFRELVEGKTEVMPYLWEHQKCRKSFSTNFMAGTKGNMLSVMWFNRLTKLLLSRCPANLDPNDDGSVEYYKRGGCCFDPDGAPRKKCYVVFGEFGDKTAHDSIVWLDEPDKPRRLKMTCIDKWHGMAANASGSGGELLWKQFLPGPPPGYKGPIGGWMSVPKTEQRAEVCWRDGPIDLWCSQSCRYPNFFKRHGYHLFNLNNNDLIVGWRSEQEFLNSGSVIAELYRLALEGEPQNDPRFLALNLPAPRTVREQDLARNRKWWDTKQWKLPWLAEH